MYHLERIRAENRQEMYANSVTFRRTSRVQRFLLHKRIQNVRLDSDTIPQNHTG